MRRLILEGDLDKRVRETVEGRHGGQRQEDNVELCEVQPKLCMYSIVMDVGDGKSRPRSQMRAAGTVGACEHASDTRRPV